MADTSSSGVESKPGDSYSIPQETQKIFAEGILGNPLIRKDLPKNFEAYAAKIRFEGSDLPSVPINWRFAESISALKGLEAVFLNALLAEKYDLDPQDILIDTDHAQLFFMSALLWQIHVDDGPPLTTASFGDKVAKQKYDALIKDCDFHGMQSGMYRSQATNIYKTRDGRFFHLHGSLNPEPTLDSIGLPHQMDAGSVEEARAPFVDALSKINSDEMQKLASETFKQAGTICWTTEEYAESEHGKANAHIGLYEIHARPNAAQGPCWWPPIQQTSAQRPLAGLRVVDLSRIIAAPAITRGLAEMGASVMRVTAPHVPDASMLHVDLNWGKWNSCLDLRRPEDRVALKALIMKADVVVSGYRPGVLDKYGFGVEDILDMCKHRENGIIVARENCYGWQGPWSERSGWQQLSDANCGVSMEFGRAMGNDEPVTPVFPNSDYCTGVAGVCGILDAILRRGRDGGSYLVDIALNYYSQWLVRSVGVYPPATWAQLWATSGLRPFRHDEGMTALLPPVMGALMRHRAATLFKPQHFEAQPSAALGRRTVTTVRPILRFPAARVRLGYHVSTRGNGVDQPRWPDDLMDEIVK